MNAKQNFFPQILSNLQLGLDFSDLFYDKKLQKIANNTKNRQTCDFCDFSQAHEKSQFSQLRTNLDISITLG